MADDVRVKDRETTTPLMRKRERDYPELKGMTEKEVYMEARLSYGWRRRSCGWDLKTQQKN